VRGRAPELPIGGTAVGTGINTNPEFAKRVTAACPKHAIEFTEPRTTLKPKQQGTLAEASASPCHRHRPH
jgi:fumarate hydratase class II